MPSEQNVQLALRACENAHTGIHRAIAELKNGSPQTAKEMLARQITFIANAMVVL